MKYHKYYLLKELQLTSMSNRKNYLEDVYKLEKVNLFYENKDRKATKEYRQPTKFKYKTFSMPHNFWLKILDKGLIDSKLSPNIQSTRNEKNAFK